MVVCYECSHNAPVGALFCTECGEHLIELGGLPAVADDLTIEKKPDLLGQSGGEGAYHTHVLFMIPVSGRRLELPIQTTIRVGRHQPGESDVPELDLSEDGGKSAGVSRDHARIQLLEDGHTLTLTDLGSTNGTLLNHFPLPPELPYPINHGDEIYFGNLVVHVFFK